MGKKRISGKKIKIFIQKIEKNKKSFFLLSLFLFLFFLFGGFLLGRLFYSYKKAYFFKKEQEKREKFKKRLEEKFGNNYIVRIVD